MAATEPAVAVAAPSREELLARERREVPRAGLVALASAILGLAAGILPQAILSDFPRVFLVDALRDAAGEPIGRPGLATAQVLAYDRHSLALVGVAVLALLAVLSLAYVLAVLQRAADARGAALPRPARLAAIGGALSIGVAGVGLSIARAISAHDFAGASDHSTKAAHDALNPGSSVVWGLLGSLGALALAAGFVLIALAAMRVGLLTRFAGVLGVIVGVLVVLGGVLGGSSFIVQSFWLLMVGVLLLGRWPGGSPPAWARGEAVPWPTQQEIREQRERARGGGAAAPAAPAAAAAEPAEAPEPGAPTPRKKKRKRR